MVADSFADEVFPCRMIGFFPMAMPAVRIGAERTILTHMTHDVDYATLATELPEGVIPASDGMVLDL